MNKDERYEELLLELRSLIGEEKEEVSVLSNVVAALHEKFGFFFLHSKIIHFTSLQDPSGFWV